MMMCMHPVVVSFTDRVPTLVAEAVPAVLITVALAGPVVKELTDAESALPPNVVDVPDSFEVGTATGLITG
jgi:hypothetical protein